VGEAADRLAAELGTGWTPLGDAVNGMAESDWHRATSAGWTVKEMLAHVAFWDEAAVPVITYMLRGREIPRRDWFGSGFMAPEDREWPPDYEHNAREASWGREHSVEEVRDRLLAAHEAAVAAASSITDEEAPGHARYIKDHSDHYGEHLAELRAALGK
jgi:hypothetical protein